MENAIEVKNVFKKLGGKPILNDISFNIKQGQIVGLVGPNGAGKSTLLKVMTGLYKIDSGKVLYNGLDITKNYEEAMKNVGCIIENPDMYKNLTGSENLELFKSMFKGIDERTVSNIVNIINLEKSLGKKFKTYSLGTKERLGLVTALINNPKILILDEPTNGLDPIGIKNLREFLKSLKDTTILISSHLLSEIENICNDVIFINNGAIVKRKQNNDIMKKYVEFEVDDCSKAKYIMSEFSVNEDLKVYATDEEISQINKTLIYNNVKVYRIMESNNFLEEEFFKVIGETKNETN